jgi:hypothetical protein
MKEIRTAQEYRLETYEDNKVMDIERYETFHDLQDRVERFQALGEKFFAYILFTNGEIKLLNF